MGRVGGDRNRRLHVGGGRRRIAECQVRLYETGEVRLADYDIGRYPVFGRNRVVDENPIILRVGNVQLAARDPDADRSAKRSGGGRHGRSVVREVGLPDHDIRGLPVCMRHRKPDQDAIVVGIGNGQHFTVGGKAGRVAHSGRGESVIRADEIRLPQHEARLSATHAAGAADDGGILQRARVSADVAELEHPVIVGKRAKTVGISYPQNPVRISDAAGRAKQLVRCAKILGGEIALPDYQTGSLASGKTRGRGLRG